MSELRCHVIATRETGGSVWSFYLVNDGESAIGEATLEAVNYEFGDAYRGGETPNKIVRNLAPGERALVWTDDGSSEMRTDLWVRIASVKLLFEFPRLYRQTGTMLESLPMVVLE